MEDDAKYPGRNPVGWSDLVHWVELYCGDDGRDGDVPAEFAALPELDPFRFYPRGWWRALEHHIQ